MRLYWLIVISLLLSCDLLTIDNPDYCIDSTSCDLGFSCHPILHRCQSSPAILGVEPAVGPSSGNVAIKIKGLNFRPGLQVLFNDKEATINALSDEEISITLPPSPGSCGPAIVSLRASDGDGTETAKLFRYKYGQILYTPVANAPIVDTNAKSIVAAQLDGDNVNDLVLANSTSSTLSVLRGVGDSSFDAMPAFSAMFPVTTASVADLDGDGVNDLLANSAANFVLFKGQGNLSFTQKGQSVYSNKLIKIGDFNNDNHLDLLTLSSSQTQIDLFINKTNWSFTQQSITSLPSAASALVVGDFDGNGKLDFVASDDANGRALLYLGHGDGSFSTGNPIMTGIGASLFAASDLNADGKLDLVAAINGGGQAQLIAAYGQGDGSFMTTASSIAANPRLLTLSDLDCDGLPEALIYHQGSTQLLVYGNRGGNAGFDAPTAVRSGVIVGAFTSALLDGDTKPDLALLSATAPASLVLLRNASN